MMTNRCGSELKGQAHLQKADIFKYLSTIISSSDILTPSETYLGISLNSHFAHFRVYINIFILSCAHILAHLAFCELKIQTI